jgi:hypothetical protein
MERKIRENSSSGSASDFRKGTAVEKQKWSSPMTAFKKLQSFQEGQLGRPNGFALFCDGFVSFRVNASLRPAESAIDRRDR